MRFALNYQACEYRQKKCSEHIDPTYWTKTKRAKNDILLYWCKLLGIEETG